MRIFHSQACLPRGPGIIVTHHHHHHHRVQSGAMDDSCAHHMAVWQLQELMHSSAAVWAPHCQDLCRATQAKLMVVQQVDVHGGRENMCACAMLRAAACGSGSAGGCCCQMHDTQGTAFHSWGVRLRYGLQYFVQSVRHTPCVLAAGGMLGVDNQFYWLWPGRQCVQRR